MKNRIQREIDAILFANVKRFMEEYYEKGRTRTDLAVDPSFFSQLAGGHASLGKEVVEGLAKVFGKKVYQMYMPEDLRSKDTALRGRFISVWGGKRNEPEAFSEGGLPLGVSMKQELSDSTDPYVFAWEISEISCEDYDGITIRPGDIMVVEPGQEVFPGQLVWSRCCGKIRVFNYFPHDDNIELRPVACREKAILLTKNDHDYQIYPVVKIIRPVRKL